jgi:hypothetical protein
MPNAAGVDAGKLVQSRSAEHRVSAHASFASFVASSSGDHPARVSSCDASPCPPSFGLLPPRRRRLGLPLARLAGGAKKAPSPGAKREGPSGVCPHAPCCAQPSHVGPRTPSFTRQGFLPHVGQAVAGGAVQWQQRRASGARARAHDPPPARHLIRSAALRALDHQHHYARAAHTKHPH